MSRKRTVAEVTPLDYTPKVGAVRHLTLTLPKSHWSGFGGGKIRHNGNAER